MVAIIVLWILLGIMALIVIALHFSVTAEISADRKNVEYKIKYLWFTIYPRPPKKPKKKRHKKSKKKKTEGFEKSSDETLPAKPQTEAPPEIPIEQLLEQEAEEVDAVENENEEENNDSLTSEDVTEKTESENDKPEPSDKTESVQEKKSEEKKQADTEKPHKEKTVKEDKKQNGRLDKIKDSWEKYKKYIPMGCKYFRKLLKTIRFTDTEIDLTVGKEDACEAALFYGKIQGVLFNLISLISGVFTVKINKANVNCVFDKKTFDGAVKTKIRIRPSALIALAFCMLAAFLKMYLPEFIKKSKKEITRKNQMTVRKLSEYKMKG